METREQLALEMLDVADGHWRPLSCVGRRSVGGGWQMSQFAGQVRPIEPTEAEAMVAAIARDAEPAVEILDVYVTANGERTVLLKEREPFEVCVKVMFRRPPEIADVIIKMNRSDGFHVFWQSSGLTGLTSNSPKGEKIVRFRFDPNDLAAGEFHVTVHVGNGWNYPQNFPYSEILARVINATAFRNSSRDTGH